MSPHVQLYECICCPHHYDIFPDMVDSGYAHVFWWLARLRSLPAFNFAFLGYVEGRWARLDQYRTAAKETSFPSKHTKSGIT
jgi:hypothetical protein